MSVLINDVANAYSVLPEIRPITNNPTNNYIQIHLRFRNPSIHYEIIHEGQGTKQPRIYVEIQLEFVHLATTLAYQTVMTNIINACQTHYCNGFIGNYQAQVRYRPGKNGALGRGYGYCFYPTFNAQQIAQAMQDFINRTYQIIMPVII
ncbi:MAG: hypothetical protein JNM06_02190 [Blastocatellia bacterium]|nr:hypothetical protein [Blastocatellia bacterium]